MKLNISSIFPDVATVAEEFAFIRLHRAKRLGRPVPRSVVNLLSESPSRDGETIRAWAKRIGITFNQAQYRLHQLGMTRGQVEAGVRL